MFPFLFDIIRHSTSLWYIFCFRHLVSFYMIKSWSNYSIHSFVPFLFTRIEFQCVCVYFRGVYAQRWFGINFCVPLICSNLMNWKIRISYSFFFKMTNGSNLDNWKWTLFLLFSFVWPVSGVWTVMFTQNLIKMSSLVDYWQSWWTFMQFQLFINGILTSHS